LKKPSRTLNLRISIWGRQKRVGGPVAIHIAESSGKIISTVNDQLGGARRHRHLYAKLKDRLQKANRWPFAPS
jgi:hypothetical protein